MSRMSIMATGSCYFISFTALTRQVRTAGVKTKAFRLCKTEEFHRARYQSSGCYSWPPGLQRARCLYFQNSPIFFKTGLQCLLCRQLITERHQRRSPRRTSKRYRLAPCKVIQDSRGFWIPPCGFRYRNPDSLLAELGFRVPVVSGIPDSLSCNSGFHKKKFLGFRIPQA